MEPQIISSASKVKLTPQDFFLYLGIVISMYLSVGVLLAFVFDLINYFTSDPAVGNGNYYTYVYGLDSVRWELSMLIVLWPIFSVLLWQSLKRLIADPARQSLGFRKWLIYLTIFSSGVIFAGDIIAAINVYLGGDLGLRFALKALAILIASALVFVGCLLDLKGYWTNNPKKARISIIGAGILVLAVVVFGLITIGSPSRQRELLRDSTRTQDVDSIKWRTVNYWQVKRTLPTDTTALVNSVEEYRVPVDPLTGAAYGYTKKTDLSFELCATFEHEAVGRMFNAGGRGPIGFHATDTSIPYPMPQPSGDADLYKHDAGRRCYTYTIDPDLYPRD